MSKKKAQFKPNDKDKRNILLAAVGGVLLMGLWLYFLFFKPISPDKRVAAEYVAQAAQNPDSPEVKKVLASGKAVKIDLSGCPNLCKVSDKLYRGAQPTQEGFENLKKLGVKTVVNLRDHHSDQDLLASTGLKYIAIPMDAWDVTSEEIIHFLKTVNDPNSAPVFVHCQHGADRTGAMIAAYRMVVMEWNADRAIWEMTQGGYGYHPMWVELPGVLRGLNIEQLRKQINEVPVNK